MNIKLKFKILLLSFIIMLFPQVANAEEGFFVPQYTEEYKMWMELSEEEKKNSIEPPMYEIPEEIKENAIQTLSEENQLNVGTSTLPERFQRTDYGEVKDQGFTGSCWAYSASTVFDNNYYITNSKKRQFSADHIDYISSNDYNDQGFYRQYDSGGNMSIALAYATNGMGIALEEDMIENELTVESLKNVPTVSKVSDYEIIWGRENIKNYIYKYGAIGSYTHINGPEYFSSPYIYYNDDLAYYCSDYSLMTNHAITIVGWDDNYTNSAFEGLKGAYIVLNSYGEEFGNNGLYYIFYDDVFIDYYTLHAVTKTDDIDYEKLYQHDTHGQTAMIGWWDGTYASNVFKRDSSQEEILTELGIYFTLDEAVTVYINAKDGDSNISKATYAFTTEPQNAGYHTIKLPKAVKLTGDKFAVSVKYGSYMPVEMSSGEEKESWYYNVTSSIGESYVSGNGNSWQDLKTLSDLDGYATNACIKAFTEEDKTIVVPADLVNYVFDYKYYADHNLDLYDLFGYNEGALKSHWENYGKAEGRKSSCIFDVKYYVENNADLAVFKNDYVGAYNHFVNYGFAEYRRSSLEYDGKFYKNNNGDLTKMSSIDLIRHYFKYGKNELRQASDNFDVVSFLLDVSLYTELNPDVASVCGYDYINLVNHWYRHGISEGRIASLVFDPKYYLEKHKDVAVASGSTNYSAAYSHFVNYGFAEGRQGSKVFSVKEYLNKNGDIKSAFGKNYLKAVNHFVNFGIKEAREASTEFSVRQYMLKNGDLENAFNKNYEAYFRHYLKYGQYEKRDCI